MVFMLMGVVSPGGGGCPGRAAFTKVLERVLFVLCIGECQCECVCVKGDCVKMIV